MARKAATAPVVPAPELGTEDWFQDRIVRFARLPASQLVPHPKNWRLHNPNQRVAVRGILAKIGLVSAIIVREMPDGTFQILDGHLRRDLCEGSMAVPCLIVNATDEEADWIVATYDPAGDLAVPDDQKADALARELITDDASMNLLLKELLLRDRRVVPREKSEHAMEVALDLAPHLYEGYDYVVLMCNTTMDFDRLCELLGIAKQDFTVPGGAKKIGMGRVIFADQFMPLLERGLNHAAV